jgi:hypothetical protein
MEGVRIEYKRIPVADSKSENILVHMDESFAFINNAIQENGKEANSVHFKDQHMRLCLISWSTRCGHGSLFHGHQ